MNLEKLNLVELNTQELKETEGGWWGAALSLVLYVASEWDDVKAGFKQGVSGQNYNYNK